jgi:hypothetical protein
MNPVLKCAEVCFDSQVSGEVARQKGVLNAAIIAAVVEEFLRGVELVRQDYFNQLAIRF